MTPAVRGERCWTWVANLLLPGSGFVRLGRVVVGSALAVGWGLVVGSAFFLALFRTGPTATVWERCLRGVAVAAYVGVQAALYGRLRSVARLEGEESRDEQFKSVLVAYLRGQLEEAEVIAKGLLRRNPDDVEATLQLAMIARRRGDTASARAYLGRARYLDDEGRWDLEIERELADLAGPAVPAPK